MIDLEKEMARAYEQGWLEAAEWANRGDLAHDAESPAYIAAREKRLTGIRALFKGKVLCDAEPAGYRYRRPNHGTWDTYYSDTKVADSIAHMQEPLYAAAKEQ